MRRIFRPWIFQWRVLDRVGWTDNLGWAVLTLGRPHGQAGEEAAVGELELAEGVGDITSA